MILARIAENNRKLKLRQARVAEQNASAAQTNYAKSQAWRKAAKLWGELGEDGKQAICEAEARTAEEARKREA